MAKRRVCPACHRTFTKGARALFAARTGARPATVCSKCAAGGVLIVPDQTGDLSQCMNCTNPAVVCLACVAKAKGKDGAK